jgi:hypothetical protein
VVVPSRVGVGRSVAVAVGSGDGGGEAKGVSRAITVGEEGGVVGCAGVSSPHLKMTNANVVPTKRRASKTTKRRERLEDILPPSERVAAL